eukprot:TRINITY_DN2646_c0_g1_i1.p1 TRINITY_DN2646_c0_g1~~TRINITY_DN2646_c0_g1_i1.p1  ORF type:complete len:429 (-),score=117.62 TRINITY_DN2646_c0_g1_i1:47-1333(-)
MAGQSFSILSVIVLVACVCLVQSQSADCIQNAEMPNGFCSSIFLDGLLGPRGLITAENNDIIVVESGSGSVSVIYDDGNAMKKSTLATAPGLDHSVSINSGYLYASSASTVYRWSYSAGDRNDLGTPEIIVKDIPTGGHSTRSLVFDNSGNILVQCGSGSNLDRTPERAGIWAYSLASIPSGGYSWSSGSLVANGLRNEVGLRYDNEGQLWGVENGMDNLVRPDFGDIHNENPGEEVNLITGKGLFYGYPYCWSQYSTDLSNGTTPVQTPRGTQWVEPSFTPSYSDEWCQNTNNVVPPAYLLPAHTAPMDIIFYPSSGAWPNFTGNALVSQHGSWDRQPPKGYRITKLIMEQGKIVSDEPFFAYKGPGDTSTSWPFRPVSMTWAKRGEEEEECLLFTSDSSGQIISVVFGNNRAAKKNMINNHDVNIV